MTHPTDSQAIALFRYGLIADVLHLPAGSRGLYECLRQKAAAHYTIPGSSRTRVAAETLRHWVKAYRRGGFEALHPKVRADRGRSRALPQALADALVSAKEETPHLSIPQLIAAVADTLPDSLRAPGVKPAPSTVHRLLARAGLMDKAAVGDGASGADRRRFAFAEPGQLWMSDVMHGPSVGMPGTRQRRKTYLIAFLDDATRVVPYCAFCLSENTQAFLPVFKQALQRRGLPQRLYVDNGANYRSQQLALVCAKLGVALIHARPYQPQGKGKQERWFRTVRAQLLATLTEADTVSLDALKPQAVGLGRSRVSPQPASWPGGRDAAGPLGDEPGIAQAARGARSGCAVPVRGQAARAARSHREPVGGAVRGRCRTGGRISHAALRPELAPRARHRGLA